MDTVGYAGRMTPKEGRIAGLLLAAGGRRLGGRPKALLEHRGRTLVEHAVASLRTAGCERVHVVLGASARPYGSGRICPAAYWWTTRTGRRHGSSLRAGLGSLAGTGAPAALVLLVDQPGIGPDAVARVLAAYENEASLVSAAYDGYAASGAVRRRPLGGRRGGGDGRSRGARLPQGPRERDQLVECGDVAQPYDIDTQADLARLE